MIGEISVTAFNGDQATADAVASLHLGIRLEQVAEGVNKFPDIYDSQADLQGMQQYYVEPGGNFWTALDNSTQHIIGFVGLRKEAENIGQLKRMAVIKEYRRQHIGQRLGQALIDWARENGFEIIRLATGEEEKGHDLYQKLGFSEVGFDANQRDHFMELVLH